MKICIGIILFFSFVTANIHAQAKHAAARVIMSQKDSGRYCFMEVVDSFFYNNGQVKEVAKSQLRRRGKRVVDSVSIDKRMLVLSNF